MSQNILKVNRLLLFEVISSFKIKGICLDPSGLYFAISSYSNIEEENENYISVNAAFNNSYNSILRTDKSSLTFYNPHKEVDLFFKKKPDVSKYIYDSFNLYI